MQFDMKMTLGNIITIAVVALGAVFGYGDLSSKVGTLSQIATKQTSIDEKQDNRIVQVENLVRTEQITNGQALARLEADMRYVRESITDIRTTMRDNSIPRVN